MADDFKKTGLQCLELLFSRFRPGVNFAALVTDSLIEKLDKDELVWQIEQLKAMGFGGFYMHTRSGMATKYLSDDFMKLIKA